MYFLIGLAVAFMYAAWILYNLLMNIYNYMSWYISGVEEEYDTRYDPESSATWHMLFSENKEPPIIILALVIHIVFGLFLSIVFWPVLIIGVPLALISRFLRKKNIERNKIIKELRS